MRDSRATLLDATTAGDDAFLQLPLAHTTEFAPEAVITRPETAREIHVVLSGVVRLSLLARDGRERVLGYLSRGSIFGEQQALAAEDDVASPTSATAFADSRCVIGYVEPTALIAAIQARPDLLRVLLRVTHHKKQLLLEELERAAFQSARSQIAAVLSALTRERHAEDPPGAIRMSQDRLARLSGRTRVTVAAQLHALADAGAIRLERSRIVVLDPELLAAIADED